MDINQSIKNALIDMGFLAAGITHTDPPAHVDVYQNWVASGKHGDMAYLADARAMEHRANPDRILPGRGAVIVAAFPYADLTITNDQTDGPPRGRIASYAWGVDYHDILPQKLNLLADQLQILLKRPVRSRAYTDTGPILERDLAQRAGLGWIGKNTCLIIPGLGSTVLLGELFIEADLESDPPFEADRCGSCRRCIEACPTRCIGEDRTLDARRCISYLTIENKNEIPFELRENIQDWVFGCDICQQVCPWNIRFAHSPAGPSLEPRLDISRPDLQSELLLTPRDFNHKFKVSPLRRAKRRGYLRNVAVALGNSGDRGSAPQLAACLETEPEPLVRAHAAWALGRLSGSIARLALESALLRETDPSVLREIHSALAAN